MGLSRLKKKICLKRSRKLGGEFILLVRIQQESNETQGLWVKTERGWFFTKLVVKLWNITRCCRSQKFPNVKKLAGYINGEIPSNIKQKQTVSGSGSPYQSLQSHWWLDECFREALIDDPVIVLFLHSSLGSCYQTLQ